MHPVPGMLWLQTPYCISSTEQPRLRSFTGRAIPWRMGPRRWHQPKRWTRWDKLYFPTSDMGRQVHLCFLLSYTMGALEAPTDGTIAASACNSSVDLEVPEQVSFARAVASTTLSTHRMRGRSPWSRSWAWQHVDSKSGNSLGCFGCTHTAIWESWSASGELTATLLQTITPFSPYSGFLCDGEAWPPTGHR